MERTAEDAVKLFGSLEQQFPYETVGEDRWYLVAVRLSSQDSKIPDQADVAASSLLSPVAQSQNSLPVSTAI